MLSVLVLILALLVSLSLSQHEVNQRRQQQDSDHAVRVSSLGINLMFNDPAARTVLAGWARELDASAGEVTHMTAMERESTVVDLVNKGQWSVDAYHDYQRMAAGTGNVDSGNLLLEYGLKSSAMALLMATENPGVKALHKAIAQCWAVEEVRVMLRRGSLAEGAEEDDVLSIESRLSDGSTPLLTATYHNCTAIVIFLLEEGADVSAVGAAGVTAVMIAAMRDLPNMIELIVTHPTVPSNTINSRHKFAATTALHFAAELGNSRSVQALCRLGADAKLESSVGATPLHVLAYSHSNDEFTETQVRRIVTALVDDCGSPVDGLMGGDTTALYLASQHNKDHVVRALLRAGADARLPMPVNEFKGNKHIARPGSGLDAEDYMLNSEAANGAEAIHAAVEEGHVNIVRILLEEGSADINTVNMDTPPLVLAISYRRLAVIDLLLAKGADVNNRSLRDGGSPLYYATQLRQLSTIKKLMQMGADSSIEQLLGGLTPLMLGAVTGYIDTLRTIIDCIRAIGGDAEVAIAVNYASTLKEGTTALHMAAAAGQIRSAMLLLKEGAGPSRDLRDVAGLLPIHHACRGGHAEMVDLLLVHGKGTTVSRYVSTMGTLQQESPLYLAVVSRSEKVVRLLLRSGADPNIEQIFLTESAPVYRSVLFVAIDLKLPSIIEALLAAGASTEKGGGSIESKPPLLYAVLKNECVECVGALLRGGADCHVVMQSRQGSESLVDVARRQRNFDLLKLLSSSKRCN